MRTLHIHLQDGFQNDHVQITVNGREVFNESDVTTMLLLGFAAQLEVDVDRRDTIVEVAVSDRGLENSIELVVELETWLGLSLDAAGITTIVSDSPFTYA